MPVLAPVITTVFPISRALLWQVALNGHMTATMTPASQNKQTRLIYRWQCDLAVLPGVHEWAHARILYAFERGFKATPSSFGCSRRWGSTVRLLLSRRGNNEAWKWGTPRKRRRSERRTNVCHHRTKILLPREFACCSLDHNWFFRTVVGEVEVDGMLWTHFVLNKTSFLFLFFMIYWYLFALSLWVKVVKGWRHA